MEYLTIILQIVTILFVIYYYLNRKFSYWSNLGVPGPKPKFFFGNFLDIYKQGQVNVEKEWAAKYGKNYGMYLGFIPVYTILDPEVAKTVLIKDFPVFVNRQLNPSNNDIFNFNLFNAEDEVWRRVRAITSPTFTSCKLKAMHSIMNHSVDKLSDYLSKAVEIDNGIMNIKKVAVGFTFDVIATTTFSTETHTNDDRSKENLLLVKGENFFDVKFLRFLLLFTMPRAFNKLICNETGCDARVVDFFIDLSKEIINQRKKQQNGLKSSAKRNDLVQLMLDVFEDNQNDNQNIAKDSPVMGGIRRSLNEDEILGQCLIFLLAGFETTGTTIANALYNLAVNPLTQERLHSDLEKALNGIEEGSSEYYDIVNGNSVPYLDSVIKETLRLVPPLPRIQRRVGVDGYVLDGIPLPKGQTVEISAFAIHHNPQFYPEPEVFKPERFMPENKDKLVPYTYLPFGGGNRSCVGMRFAYQEIRLCLAKLVRKYKFAPTLETKIPLEYTKIGFVRAKDVQLQVSKR